MNLFSRALSRAAVEAVNKELHKPQKGDGRTVHLPKLLLVIGIICTAVFLIPACYFIFFEKELGGLGILAMSLLSSSMIIGYVNQRIYYDEDGFTAKSFFGIKRRYSYTDIECCSAEIPHNLDKVIDDEDFDDIDYVLNLMSEDYKLKVRGKTILIDQIAVGGLEFLAFAQKQYKAFNCDRPIPKKKKTTKCDAIFNGNVKNPGAQVFIYILIFALNVGVIALGFVLNKPTEMDDLQFNTVTVNSYEANKEHLYLDIDGFKTEPYLRGYKQTIADQARFMALLNEKQEFEIGYETFVDDGVTEYRIEYIRDKNGTVLTTPEDFHEFYQHDFNIIMSIMVSFLVLWVVYVLFVIYVGRNPHKFSPKLVHKLYKEGSIKL